MPLLGRISFVLGATAVTLLAVGCAARHEPAPTVAAGAAPPAAPATPLLAPTWPDAAPVPEASAPDAAGPAPDPERIAEFAPREELKDVHFASGHIQVERRDLASLDAAVFSGVADLRRIFEAARQRRRDGKGTLLFVDEIHRFNRAQQDGFFKEELAPLQVVRGIVDKKTGEIVGKEDYYVDKDECNRPDTTLEGLMSLPPHFDKTSGKGTVTAGNSSQLSDGASATLVMSADRAKALGIKPKLIFRGFAVAGCEPDEMGIGPIYAVPKLLKRNGLTMDDIDVWELNEAFASQVVYCRDKLGIPMDKLNLNGGSISIGHPFGMTGSRMVGTIANEMLRRKAKYGVVTMCIGGGQGAAGLFESCL